MQQQWTAAAGNSNSQLGAYGCMMLVVLLAPPTTDAHMLSHVLLGSSCVRPCTLHVFSCMLVMQLWARLYGAGGSSRSTHQLTHTR